ncbi:CAP-Gly domain-containing linker protein 1-like isoform X2 [Ruditapes philippinarum]|uniref:CAP-Gly domain-containing linker protein 1-like isoform X2 n=1 Tax=Ruditapes philippinarum TaxID=129788 RepID=UPI00295B3183|nr:CAP-Gly domain-containing linker protein 1-like isoform X2 [Ruditapes philippinarum]
MYEKRSGKYNRFAYISDDNIDGDSADDLIDDENEDQIDSHEKMIESDKNVPQKEISSLKKKEMKSMDSLDLLLDEQGDFVDGSQQVINLEREYLDALKFTEESKNKNGTRPENSNSESHKNGDKYTVTTATKGLQIKDEIDNLTQKLASDFDGEREKNEDIKTETLDLHPSSINTKDEQKNSKPLKNKAKLETQNTLDILLEQQGDLVDQSTEIIEFDADLLASLEQNFKENILVQQSSQALSKEYAYLGIQHGVVQKSNENQHGTSSPNQDDFDSIVEGAKDYLDGGEAKDSVPVADSLSQVRKYIHHDTSPDSSDSDMLSVIEEVDDEISDSDDDDARGDIKNSNELQRSLKVARKTFNTEPRDIERTEKAKQYDTTRTTIEKESATGCDDRVPEDEIKPQVKGKIFLKARDIEQRMKNLVKGGGSSSVITSKKDDVKRDKYKKVHDHWLALERHEADMLDIDELDKATNEGNSQKDEVNAVTALVTEDVKTEWEEEIIDSPVDHVITNEDRDFEVGMNSGVSKAEIHNTEETFEKRLCLETKSEHSDQAMSGKLDEVKTEIIDSPESSVKTLINEDEHVEEKILNSTVNDQKGASINDSTVFCHTLSDISSLTDIESQGDIHINTQVNEQTNHNNASINDSNVFCHTLSDISSLTDTGLLDNSVTDNQTDVRQVTDNEVSASARNSCHSLPDEDKEQILEVVNNQNQSELKTSINDSRASCHSISELHDPVLENLSQETSSICLNLQGGLTVELPQDVKDDVFHDKNVENSMKQESTNKERLSSDEIRFEIRNMQQSQKRYTTEIELNVDMGGKITPPAMSKDLQFFKPPDKPPRIKKTSSSGPSSPEFTTINPKVYVDSPRTEKLASARDSPRDSPRTISECSISQDDSGNVSGGSRGTTPEHRRTDSSYSQSSIPSTLSNVTDDSRESLASYYSDAGDIAYSNIPITGEILFSLNYNYKTNMLEVGVKQCRNIAVADLRRRRSDPYVKTYLLPDRTRGGKRKTKVKKHSTSPTFDETLKYSLTKSELENRTLWLTVWHNDRFGRNVFLGEVTINFDYYKFEDPFPRWYPLQERMDAPPPSMMVYKGDLSLCIKFVPADKLGASSSGKQKKDSGKGQLQVMVKEARNLTAVKSNGFSDPFCKGYLLPERHKSSKQKTAVVKKDCSPVWNHTFIFEDVTLTELRERCLELTIWDYEKLASNDFLGGVRLNLGSGVSGGKQVDWMDARGEEMSMWQAMLDRPNFWIDGALILRPNMDKRKY